MKIQFNIHAVRGAILSVALAAMSGAASISRAENQSIETGSIPIGSELTLPTGVRNQASQSQLSDIDKEWNIANYQQGFSEQPFHYQVMREVILNPSSAGAEEALRTLKNREIELENARETWTKSIEGNINIGADVGVDISVLEVKSGVQASGTISKDFMNAEMALDAVESRHREQDMIVKGRLIQNPTSTRSMNETLFDIEEKIKAGEQLSNTELNIFKVWNAVKAQNPTMPSSASTRQGIIDGSKNPADIEARLKEAKTPEQAQQIVNEYYNEITIIKSVVNVSTDPKSKVEITLEEAEKSIEEIQASLDNPENKLTETARNDLENKKLFLENRVRRGKLEAHDAEIKLARDSIYVGYQAAIFMFGNSENLQKKYQALNAGLTIYDAAATMAINGSMTLGGVGTVLAGMNTLSSVMGPGSSGDEAISKMLQQILETLQIIDKKIDKLLDLGQRQNAKLNILIDAVRELQSKFSIDIDALNNKLNEQYINEETRDRIFAQNLVIESIVSEAEKKLGSFSLDTGNFGNELYDCLDKSETCSERARLHFNAMVQDLNAIRHAAVCVITTDPRFQRNQRSISNFKNADEIKEFMVGSLTEDRVGKVIIDLAEWVDKNYDSEKNRDIDTRFFNGLAHPSYLRGLTELYAIIAKKLPTNYGYHGSTGQVSQILDEVSDLEQASQQMRDATRIAQSVYGAKVRTYMEQISQLIREYPAKHPVGYEIMPAIILSAGGITNEKKQEIRNKESNRLKIEKESEGVVQDLLLKASPDEISKYINEQDQEHIFGIGRVLGLLTLKNETSCTPRDCSYGEFPRGKWKSIHDGTIINQFIAISDRGKREILGNAWDSHDVNMQCIDVRYGTAISPFNKFPGDRVSFLQNKNCEAKDLTQIKKFITSYMVLYQQRIISEIQKIDADGSQHRDIALGELAMQTFINAGYGECKDFDVNMGPFRSAILRMDEVSILLDKLKNSQSLAEINSTLLSIDNSLNAFMKLDLSTRNESQSVCELGFGETNKSRAALQSVINFGSSRLEQTNVRRPVIGNAPCISIR